MSEDDHMDLNRIEMSVQELLTEMKDISEVIVDLAYAALVYNSREMGQRVNELEDEMEELKYAIRVKALLAARTLEDAQQLSGILQIASAADRISHAAGDLVDLLEVPSDKRPFITNLINESDEKIRMIRISPSSEMAGYTIGKLGVEANTGMKIIALKNRYGWTYDPDDNVKLRAGDDMIVRGTEDGGNRLAQFASGKLPWEWDEDEEKEEEAVNDE